MNRFILLIVLAPCGNGLLVTMIGLLAFITSTDASSADAPAQFVRVFVVDTSSSMEGNNIETARAEILDEAKQLPPSPDYPIIVIPFTDTAGVVQRFIDQATFEAFIANLQAGGSTRIAAALAAALSELEKQKDVPHVCVLLYTDGEDNDKAGIAAQEERLNALFADRQQRGLRQTVVFCKRWSGACAELKAAIAARNLARVVDAGELRFAQVTIVPDFRVTSVIPAPSEPGVMDVAVDAKLLAKGAAAGSPLPPVKVRCLTVGASGETEFELTPGNPPATPKCLRIPYPTDARKTVDLSFRLDDPPELTTDGALVLPILPVATVTLPVTVPEIRFRSVIRVVFAPAGRTDWTDPLTRKAAVPIRLSIDIKSEPDRPWDIPVDFRITADAPGQIIAGQSTFTLTGPGAVTVDLTVESSQRTSGVPKPADAPVPIGLVIAPVKLPFNVSFVPEKIQIQHDVPPPPPVETKITGSVERITGPVWLDVRDGKALFDAHLDVIVDGPFEQDGALALNGASGLRVVRVSPSRLRTGRQKLVARLLAPLRPAPQTRTFLLQLEAPSSNGAVTVLEPKPWPLTVRGPRAPRMVLASGATVPNLFSLRSADNVPSSPLLVRPVLVGVQDSRSALGLKAVIRIEGPLALSTAAEPIDVYRPIKVEVTRTSSVRPSFFQDTRLVGSITVRPDLPQSPVIGSVQRVEYVLEAPFKRLAFYVSGVVCSLFAVFLVVRVWRRLTTIEHSSTPL